MDLPEVSGAVIGGRQVRELVLGGNVLWSAPALTGLTGLAAARTCGVGDLVYNQYGAPLRPDDRYPGWGAHEAPLGVNSTFDWGVGARPGLRAHHRYGRTVYTHHNVWGQVVPAAGGSPERRVRVEVERPQVFHLAAGATTWTRVRGTAEDVKNFEGGYWTGQTFAKVRDMRRSEVRTEPWGNSFSARPLTRRNGRPSRACIGHWSYSGFFPRLPVPTGGRVAIYTRMRLVGTTDAVDVSRARLLAAFSGDLYTSRRAVVGRNGRNPPLAIPRHKLLTGTWQPFTYVSATADQIPGLPVLPLG